MIYGIYSKWILNVKLCLDFVLGSFLSMTIIEVLSCCSQRFIFNNVVQRLTVNFWSADEMTYVNLLLNPERYTGYTGPSARRIWDAVYSENCPKCELKLLVDFRGQFDCSVCLQYFIIKMLDIAFIFVYPINSSEGDMICTLWREG